MRADRLACCRLVVAQPVAGQRQRAGTEVDDAAIWTRAIILFFAAPANSPRAEGVEKEMIWKRAAFAYDAGVALPLG